MSIDENEQPAESAAKQDEEWRLQRGGALPRERQRPAMEKNDQRQQQHNIFEGDGAVERQTSAHQLRRDEVDEKRVGQPRAGELRMLRRKISAGHESFDDVDVQRQIVPVDEEAGVNAVGRLVDNRGKDEHEGSGEQHEEAEAPERRAVITAECAAHSRGSGAYVRICRFAGVVPNEDGQRSGRERGASQQRGEAETEEGGGHETDEPEYCQPDAGSRGQPGGEGRSLVVQDRSRRYRPP